MSPPLRRPVSRTAVALVAGVASAIAYGVASAVQHNQAGQVEQGNPLNPGLLVMLARRPLWWLGLTADVVAVALQAVALRFGPVLLVQLLVVGGLPVAVVLSTAAARARPARRDLLGLLLCTGGLALAVPAFTSVPVGHPVSSGKGVVAGTTVGLAVLLLVGLARRRRASAPLATGVAAGIMAGASSVLLALVVARIGNPIGLATSAVPYAALGAGLLTLLLSQAAFQTGFLATPLAALSVTEPATAGVLAVTTLHERLPTATGALLAAVLGLSAAVAGVLVLAGTRERINGGEQPLGKA